MERLVFRGRIERLCDARQTVFGSQRHSPSNRLTGAQTEPPAAGRPLSGLAGRAGGRHGRSCRRAACAGWPSRRPAFCPPAARLRKHQMPRPESANGEQPIQGMLLPFPGAHRRVARNACKSFDGHDPDGTGEVTDG